MKIPTQKSGTNGIYKNIIPKRIQFLQQQQKVN